MKNTVINHAALQALVKAHITAAFPDTWRPAEMCGEETPVPALAALLNLNSSQRGGADLAFTLGVDIALEVVSAVLGSGPGIIVDSEALEEIVARYRETWIGYRKMEIWDETGVTPENQPPLPEEGVAA